MQDKLREHYKLSKGEREGGRERESMSRTTYMYHEAHNYIQLMYMYVPQLCIRTFRLGVGKHAGMQAWVKTSFNTYINYFMHVCTIS